jgi:hypothetical protein
MNEHYELKTPRVFEYPGSNQEARDALIETLEELGFKVLAKSPHIYFSGDFKKFFPGFSPWRKPILTVEDINDAASGKNRDKPDGKLCIYMRPSFRNPVCEIAIPVHDQHYLDQRISECFENQFRRLALILESTRQNFAIAAISAQLCLPITSCSRAPVASTYSQWAMDIIRVRRICRKLSSAKRESP